LNCGGTGTPIHSASARPAAQTAFWMDQGVPSVAHQTLAADLAERFTARLRLFALRRLRDRGLAEDVAQEALRRTVQALADGKVINPEALPGFLFETARHICQQHLRHSGRESRALGVLSAGTHEHSIDPDPLAQLVSSESAEHTRSALAQLSDADRDLLQLAFTEGLDARTIGTRLGLSEGAVRVRRHRALRRLAAILGVTVPQPGEL
jgi:RNA polymerase sigma-70 factor, ECF subfamily